MDEDRYITFSYKFGPKMKQDESSVLVTHYKTLKIWQIFAICQQSYSTSYYISDMMTK